MFHTAVRCAISSMATSNSVWRHRPTASASSGDSPSSAPLRRLNAAYRYVHIRLCSSSAASYSAWRTASRSANRGAATASFMKISRRTRHGVPEPRGAQSGQVAGDDFLRGGPEGLSKRRDPCKTHALETLPPWPLMQNFAPGDLKEVLALLQTGLELPVYQREAWLAALDASKTRLKPTIAALLQKHAEHETDD